MNCPHCDFGIPKSPSGFDVGTSYEVSSCPSCGCGVKLVHECHPDIEWENDGVMDSAPGCFEYYVKEADQ